MRAASLSGDAGLDGEPPVQAVDILGVPFTLLGFESAAARVGALARRAGPTSQVVLANAHTLDLGVSDPGYRAVVAGAELVLRDGAGVELAARLAGADPGHNFVGTDFVPAVLRILASRDQGVSVFLLGGRDGVALEAARVLRQATPGLRIAGAEPGFGDLDAAVARIRVARPDVLLVALGNPLQETWIHEHRETLGAGVAIGVGALFDYLAGRVPRAPRWVRRVRGEWLFRLVIEPRRLWRRYVVGNPRFLWRLVRSRRRSLA